MGLSGKVNIRHSLADITLAEKHLGYKPVVAFEEGLRRTVEWYKKALLSLTFLCLQRSRSSGFTDVEYIPF